MKVAAVQFAPAFKERDQNIREGARLIVEAARNGAHLVVLPELCTTGFSFMNEEEAREHAEQISDWQRAGGPTSMEMFGGMARRLNVAIAWGVLEQDYGTGTLYNSQVLVLPSGQFISYRKVNLWGNDYLWAKAGTASPPITDYLGKKVGLLICRDVRDKAPAMDELYEKGDADIVCFSSNFGDGGFPSGHWVEFAKDNSAYLIVSNRYGQEANNNFGEGGICVIEPSGKVHCDGVVWNAPCIVYAEVP